MTKPYFIELSRQRRDGLLNDAQVAHAGLHMSGWHIAIAELVGNNHVLLGPQHKLGRPARAVIRLGSGSVSISKFSRPLIVCSAFTHGVYGS